ncbi:hypothetical protein CC86DRAFT_292399, partial [Ophiobolus disseminans]
IRENPHITPLATTDGHWIPSTTPQYNYRSGGGLSGAYMFCEKTRIRPVPADSLPRSLNHFKTFSVFYSGGRGFWVLRGDATAPGPDECWHPLRFEHDATDKSSHLTPAGNGDTLKCHRTDQLWAHMLLPDIYHGPQTQNPQHGGLRGELPVLLALVSMSMDPGNLQQWLPWMFQNSQWHTHSLPHGRVVVDVYTCPQSWAGGSIVQDLVDFENGVYGKYYN